MANPGDTVYPTVSQLRAVGTYVQACGLISGMEYEQGYGQIDFLTSDTIALSITPESARAIGHDVEDLTIELQVPTVDSDLYGTVHHTFAGLNFAHRVDVSVYGPHPALAHTDWIGTGGSGTPNSAGEFTVEASGTPTLTLTIPNNFEQIQAEAPYEDFPEGGPVVPLSYWYHRADYWSAAYGAERPKSHVPWDATWEGVYCWRGWGWLKTRLKVPADSSLTLSFAGKTLIPTDNHYAGTDNETGENRQTGYSATWTQWIASSQPHLVVNGQLVPVEVVPQSEDCTVYWRICLDADGATVDPEVVNTLTLTGMADGNWQLLAAPTLVLDPTVSDHAVIKVFEAAAADCDENHSGGGYRKGGISAVVDYTSYRALYWGDGSNANVVEECGGIFDKLISPNYEIDYTTAWTLAQYANLITYCSDAWTVTLDAAACAAALKDADDNEIPVWAFDIREDQITPPTAPLEQDVDGGAALVAIRCGSWEIAPGLVNVLVTDKVVGGRMHGIAQKPLGTLARSITRAAQVWRRYPDSGAFAKDGTPRPSDDAGHWRSANLDDFKEYDGDDGYRWYYAATGGIAPSASDGFAATREYLEASVTPAAEARRHGMYTDPTGGVPNYCWIDSDGAIKFNRIVAGLNTPGTAVTVDDSGDYDSVACTSQGGVIYVTARSVSGIDLFTSTDDGETWTGPTDVS
jgi:hypothetical protein